jgi:sugar lactone lactonase YvrE
LDSKTGSISTLAGTGTAGFSGDNGPATKAQLNDPHSIGFDPAGDLYICDVKNHRLRKVHLQTGTISTFAGTGEKGPTPDGARFAQVPLFGPRALDFDRAGNLWLALREGNAIYKLDLAKGTLQHIAGTGKKGFAGHGGPARAAMLNGPKGLSVAPDGNVFVADTENHAIRMIDVRSGTIALVAGTGLRGDGPEGAAVNCLLARPHGVYADADGSIFVGDSETHRIRRLDTTNAVSADLPRVFLLDAKHLTTVRHRIRNGAPGYAAALAALEQDAKELLDDRPVSVMDKSATPPSGDKHDYMSMAPYFWPDPASSNGLPYIRRDGERNPEITGISDHGNILEMPEKVETLALAWYFTGNETYASKAAEFVRVWFLNPPTRMNPHFEYAQAIRGVNTGRGIGLIESRGLARVVDAVGLLSGATPWTDRDQKGLEDWFTRFLDWMLQSKHGRDEAAAKNNHGTYYDMQVASFGMFLGRLEFATNLLRSVTTNRIAVQIEPDGRQPLELARTRAWSYSTGNLSGLMSLAKLGECVGLDLWNYQTADGRSIRKAFDFLTPYGTRQEKWPYQQLGGWSADGFSSLARRAGLKLKERRYAELAVKIARPNASERSQLLWPAIELPSSQ